MLGGASADRRGDIPGFSFFFKLFYFCGGLFFFPRDKDLLGFLTDAFKTCRAFLYLHEIFICVGDLLKTPNAWEVTEQANISACS